MNELERLKRIRLPLALRNPEGWAAIFEAKRPRHPHLHQIEPTNRCPYSCLMCPRPGRMTRPQGLMDMGVYRRIMAEVAGYPQATRSREIELFHFGESLLHPELPAMVEFGASLGLNLTLSLNPPELSPAMADRLLAAGVRKIILSLDGMDAGSYKKARGPAADFDLAVSNTEALLAARARRAGAAEIVIRAIDIRLGAESAARFRRRWEGRGATVDIRPFFPWTEKDLAPLGEWERYPAGMPCPFPWQHLVVQWNGDVVPCCRDYNAVHVLGNVRERTLEDIWNSEAYAAFRALHASGRADADAFCGGCMSLYRT